MQKATVVIKVTDTEFDMAAIAKQADVSISDSTEISGIRIAEANEDSRQLIVHVTFNRDLPSDMMREIIEATPCYVRMNITDPETDGTRDLAIEMCGFEPTT